MGFSRSAGLACCLATVLFPRAVLADDWQQPVPSSAAEEQPAANRIAPVEVKIPRLGVDAAVVPVGAEDDGAMSAPTDPDTVAWWSLGYGTGEQGNVVLAAHVDWGGRPRVFSQLGRLEPGDLVIVVDALAREFVYEVRWRDQVTAETADVNAIFAAGDRPELTLITCGGAFDPLERMYVDRIVVRAAVI